MRTLVIVLALSFVVACSGASEPTPTASTTPSSVVAPPPPPAPPPPAPPQATATEPGMPAPVDVCLVSDAGRTRATAYPSRAGVYDPSAPIDPALLNWSVPNRGCVTPPLPSTPRVPCPDEPALPAVTATLCGQ